MSPRQPPAGEVEFERVTKRYALGARRAHLSAAWPFGDGLGRGEKLLALDDVSFRVEAGEAFALVGPNGAGKSTALKCLAGVVRPSKGRVRAAGRVVSLIELGVGFHPDLTGIENARFAAAVAGIHGAAARAVVDSAVDFAEIGRFMETPVKRYSSGMYARLSFGIAVSMPADILIVDEILAVGDLAFQRKCYARLREIRSSQGATLVFVSHNEWVLKQVCERGALFDQGRLQALEPIEELIIRYHAVGHGANASPGAGGGGQHLRLSKVRLVPEDVRVVPPNAATAVEFEVDVDAAMAKAVVGVALFDAESRIIWGAYSDEQGVLLPVGRTQVRVDISDIAVLPGPCHLQVFGFDRGSPVVDDLHRLDLVVEGDTPRNAEHGVVHVPTRWSITTSAGGMS